MHQCAGPKGHLEVPGNSRWRWVASLHEHPWKLPSWLAGKTNHEWSLSTVGRNPAIYKNPVNNGDELSTWQWNNSRGSFCIGHWPCFATFCKSQLRLVVVYPHLKVFIHPRSLFGISSINGMLCACWTQFLPFSNQQSHGKITYRWSSNNPTKEKNINDSTSPTAVRFHMGVSLNGGTPKTPQNKHF